MNTLLAFQDALYQDIPLVKHMGLQLRSCDALSLSATAPLTPNINDKGTVFGGSSSALMTICGWTLIKHNLELRGLNNDVVIYQAQTDWKRSQHDDLQIAANLDAVDWDKIKQQMTTKPRSIRLPVLNTVQNAQGDICTVMQATYVILK